MYKFSSISKYFDNFNLVLNNIHQLITNDNFLNVIQAESFLRDYLLSENNQNKSNYESKLLLWTDVHSEINSLFNDCVLESKALNLQIPVQIDYNPNKKVGGSAKVDGTISINGASLKNQSISSLKSNLAHEITHVLSKIQSKKSDWWRNEALLDATDIKHQSQLPPEMTQFGRYYYQSPEEARANLQALIEQYHLSLTKEKIKEKALEDGISYDEEVKKIIFKIIKEFTERHVKNKSSEEHPFGPEYLNIIRKGLYDYIHQQKGLKPIENIPAPLQLIIQNAYSDFNNEKYRMGHIKAYENLLMKLKEISGKTSGATLRSNQKFLQPYVEDVEKRLEMLRQKMKSTENNNTFSSSFNFKKYSESKKKLEIYLPDYVDDILKDITQSGGKALIVGGAVRDAILGKSPKDIDFEVYRLSYDQLNNILSKYGKADLVGQMFGVIKFVGKDGSDFDFSLPRKDSKSGVGHKDFSVEISGDLTPIEAAARRDFTINAISYDPITHEIVDPFNGRADLENKILRHTSNAFSEDPLRVLRGMQFASRFGFEIAPETAKLAESIRDEFKHLPKERIYEEFKKLVTKGIEPGKALDFLYSTGWSKNFPEIHDLKDTPQDPEWHPEGDVSTHTAYVMNEAARIADRENLSPEDREVLIYAALAHDFAKPETTAVINKKGKDRITSHGHEELGGPKAESFLKSIGAPNDVIKKVIPLVQFHLSHIHHSNTSKQESFVKNLAEKIYPSNIKMLELLIEADHSGRPPLPKHLPEQAREMSELAKKFNVYEGKHPDLLQGRDIMPYLNNKGGPIIGQILKEHRNLILNHDPRMTDRESALKWLSNRMQREAAFINGHDVLNYTNYTGSKIKEILDQAWEAQLRKELNSREEAIDWLKQQ